MTAILCIRLLSLAGSLALAGASLAAEGPVRVPAPVDKLMRADKAGRKTDPKSIFSNRTRRFFP